MRDSDVRESSVISGDVRSSSINDESHRRGEKTRHI